MTISSGPFAEGSTTGFLHLAHGQQLGSMVLTHGAGLNHESPLLIAIAHSLSEAGFSVLRCDLRFRQKRPFGPPHPSSAAEDRVGLREAVSQMEKLAGGPLYLGGHSYGARQSTILMTEAEPPDVRALLLLSYPLHPPRKPDQLRTQHFPRLPTPAFFLHGTRDSFGSPDEMQKALTFIPAATPAKLCLVPSAGHELSSTKPSVLGPAVKEFLAFVDLVQSVARR